MKIHLIANMYPSKEAPSYGVFVKNTEKILENSGITVDKTVLHKRTGKFQKLIGYATYYSKIVLKGLINNYDYTYVHYAAHNSFPLLVLKALKKNTKIITNVHGSDVVPEVPSQEKYQKYVKRLLERSDKIITPSNYYKSLVKEKYLVDTPINVFPSGGVNKNIFNVRQPNKEIMSKYELDPKFQYVGYVSRLDVGKGWNILLDAISKLKNDNDLPPLKFIMVGDGKERKEFEQQVSNLKLKEEIVHFTLLPQESLADIYNCLEVFCFPTTRKGESLGLVGLEAMACGAPVVGSRIGGLLDYVKDGENGLLFEPGNSEELALKIKEYFKLSDQEQELMKERAREKAEEYEVENIKPILVDIFK
jgi:L-malate glycosyltransferase